MAKIFSKTERGILSLCNPGTVFNYEDSKYRILKSGKPMPTSRGECKTDVYIEAENIVDKSKREFKISIKQKNAHFLENKLTKDRALQILGPKFSEIIKKSIENTKDSFVEEDLVIYEKKGPTQAKSIKMGWRFELFLLKQGNKSELMILTNEQKLDVFAGTNLSEEKKNSIVAGEIVENSGVANFVLVVDETVEIGVDLDQYFKQLKPIEIFSQENEVYFGCKAINYRADKKGKLKWEGDRSLSVFVDWSLSENKKLTGKLIFDTPLEKTGHQIGMHLSEILKEIDVKAENFNDLKKYVIKDS
jgi:hypothetical protein